MGLCPLGPSLGVGVGEGAQSAPPRSPSSVGYAMLASRLLHMLFQSILFTPGIMSAYIYIIFWFCYSFISWYSLLYNGIDIEHCKFIVRVGRQFPVYLHNVSVRLSCSFSYLITFIRGWSFTYLEWFTNYWNVKSGQPKYCKNSSFIM